MYNAYADAEIEKAIENYKTVISGPEYDYDEKYQYKTFVAFLKKGVQQFVDDAKPMENHKKKEIPEKGEERKRDPSRFAKYNILTGNPGAKI